MSEQVDVVVLGLGVGGEHVAGTLAENGLNVVGIEGRLVGGECPYYACVPTKMIVRAADLLAETRRVDGMAGHAEVTPDWAPVAARIRDEATDDWNDQVAVDRLVGKGVTFVRGWGRLAGPGRVEVDGTVYEANRGVVIGTGSAPFVPPIDGIEGTPYWTNRDAVQVKELPESMIVLGGGPVGLELTQGFARFGVRVTIVEMAERLLHNEEPESGELAARILESEGVDVRVGSGARSVRHDGERFTVTLADGSDVSAERLLVAVGRYCDLGAIGVDAVGLDPSAKFVEVDDHLRAGDGLWAVGDVAGHGAFTHMAMYQGDIVIRDVLGQDGPAADYRALPRVTFMDPEIGGVGLTEAQARDAGLAVRTGSTQVPSTSRGWIHKAGNDGFIKLVADTDQGVLVGATSAGPTGGEVLGALAVAVHGRVPVEQLKHMIYAYPTIHRGIGDALREL
ncbi:dihydrolipoyl dehydrogenase family protein [Jiangella mangrovi]|uniref:Pyruvate/2-oxoglutarate dehydrogenase complex dihydrolipoamide dehydrogenase (E3) component n=1 Tax=Jiangella mangrovi TaxID=1524084 RepID=A0A7W9GMG3_9ACTN|nr:NAD(P)/FAD-dependent oxidoreductase [Jiangella mangrovi]MBB5786480.1 pyruvate/2-oxoglutarate dehydrogenase complex dihydrolipoamide dehydrogenase (E3) component [Jiangella mangrovi]